MLKTPLAGAGAPNPYPARTSSRGENNTENPMSVGTYITFGKFRTMHLGDLTKNKEFELMCPSQSGRHRSTLFVGLASRPQHLEFGTDRARASHPRVAIMNNGTRKGGQPDAMKVLHTSPGLEDLWQIHFSQLSGQEYTVPGMFIANLLDAAVGGDAGGADRSAGARPEHAASARPQRPGLLDQGVRAAGRHLHRDQCAERVHQDLRRAEAGHFRQAPPPRPACGETVGWPRGRAHAWR